MITEPITDRTVAEIVADDYRTAEIFKNHGIDFCCGGKKSIKQVCTEKHIDAEQLESELLLINNKPIDREHNFNEWGVSFLIDYIVELHHKYVNNNLGLISEFAAKVATVHGNHNTETVEINNIWREVVGELTVHMKKEELMLFPYIKNLDEYNKRKLKGLPSPHISTVKSPIRVMEMEHEQVGEMLHEIQRLSNNFTPPDYACNTYKVLYAKLKEFQDDLHQHIHLENNILFPKAIQLEESLS